VFPWWGNWPVVGGAVVLAHHPACPGGSVFAHQTPPGLRGFLLTTRLVRVGACLPTRRTRAETFLLTTRLVRVGACLATRGRRSGFPFTRSGTQTPSHPGKPGGDEEGVCARAALVVKHRPTRTSRAVARREEKGRGQRGTRLSFAGHRSTWTNWNMWSSSAPWRKSLTPSPPRPCPLDRQARIALTTLPCTSVRRKSRPWNLYVSRVWSMPSRCRMVAFRSWTSTGSRTMLYEKSSVSPYVSPALTPPPASQTVKVTDQPILRSGCGLAGLLR
jgi:hypothetical protein